MLTELASLLTRVAFMHHEDPLGVYQLKRDGTHQLAFYSTGLYSFIMTIDPMAIKHYASLKGLTSTLNILRKWTKTYKLYALICPFLVVFACYNKMFTTIVLSGSEIY